MPAEDIVFYRPGSLAHVNLADLDAAITWEQREAPRGEAYYADSLLPYTYGRGAGERTYEPHIVWPEILADIREHVQKDAGCHFAMLFCNRYPDEHHHIGWHADNSHLIDHSRPISVVSFGAERDIMFRRISDGVVTRQRLGHGSILHMGPGMQMSHMHRIPKHSARCDLRVSLTFRALAPALAPALAQAD